MLLLNLTQRDILEVYWNRHGESRGCHRRCCLSCGRPFFTSRPEARYCLAACRQRAYRQRMRIRRHVPLSEIPIVEPAEPVGPSTPPYRQVQNHQSAPSAGC